MLLAGSEYHRSCLGLAGAVSLVSLARFECRRSSLSLAGSSREFVEKKMGVWLLVFVVLYSG